MTKFVKGQKVICVNADNSNFLREGSTYIVEEVHYNSSGIFVRGVFWRRGRFKTIIQSIDDVVVGMELNKGASNIKYTVISKTDKHITVETINSFKYDVSKDFLSVFKEYQPKQKEKLMCREEKEYEVVKPFTLHGIWQSQKDHKCEEFNNAFQKLLYDLTYDKSFKGWRLDQKFRYFTKEMVPEIMWFYKDILKERGFIKEVEKETKLEKGMVIKDSWSNRWEVIWDQINKFGFLSVKGRYLFCYEEKPLWISTNTTLEKFNRKYIIDRDFEVVDEA